MPKAILLAGLGFGDEGKGASVDYLTRRYDADLVIRYNGGHQAGHRVQHPDGRSHVFSQFGSGTFGGARTYHARHSIIEPMAMRKEYKALLGKGLHPSISVHPDCLVTSRFLKLLNRVRETARRHKHGSCGLGIGETKKYYLDYGLDSLFAKDLQNYHLTLAKLELIKSRALEEAREVGGECEHYKILRELSPSGEAQLLFQDTVTLEMETRPQFETAIFEGAQGMLLDELWGFHPYTTWSNITFDWAYEFLADYSDVQSVSVGVTRAYHSRHGEGPFPTEDTQNIQAPRVPAWEEGNAKNNWQGSIRYGWLDKQLLQYAVDCLKPDYIMLNHMDQFPSVGYMGTRNNLIVDYSKSPLPLKQSEEFTKKLKATNAYIIQTNQLELISAIRTIRPIAVIGRGPTYKDRETLLNFKFN